MNNKHLPRLPPEYYRGDALVHWVFTIENRRKGWLTPTFYYKFRELLTHVSFRYEFACPIYCCMPDHIHLLWLGISEHSDQRLATRNFRKHLNSVLTKLNPSFRLQRQAYDHVLNEVERERDALESTVEYIARNPERSGLVPADGFQKYKLTECLVPGYPELSLWQSDYWDRFWHIYSHLRKNGLSRKPNSP